MMNVKAKNVESETAMGVETGMHVVDIKAALFQNLVYSCPRHEPGEPARESRG